jgi:hypothetical protein
MALRRDLPLRQDLQAALEIITEGDRARLSSRRRILLFGRNGERSMNALRDRHAKWIWSPSVQALAVGKKTRRGRETGELAILVLVDKKRPRRRLRHPVPRRITIDKLGTFLTDVEAIGRLEPQTFPDRVRPAMPGCSIGHVELDTWGTLGLLVKRKRDSASYVLSNSHVLALDGLGQVGDTIVQPGTGDADGSGSDDKIAELADWVPFDFTTPGFPNTVDAAIGRVTRSDSVVGAFREIVGAPAGLSFNIEEGMPVHKVGRSTDKTDGTVKHIGAKVKVPHMMDAATIKRIGFSNQVICTPYTWPGDSGAAVVNDRNEVIGLHACGSTSRSTFNPIEDVFALLNLSQTLPP